LSSAAIDPRRKGFVNAWQRVNGEQPCLSFDSELNLLAGQSHWSKCRESLDYVFAHEVSGLEPKVARLVLTEKPHLSDHFGVLVDFEII
jgi:endonuclease/exonuclease/phosphatase (EEP) superfamily protein YafD